MDLNDPRYREVFFDIHRELPREGPGSRASAARVLALIGDLPERPEILDLGCGPGEQSCTLAELTGGQVTAVDNHGPFLDQLRASAEGRGLDDRITPVEADMNDLPFEAESFDLLWSEGALYSIGFANAVSSLRRFLRPGGALAATEAVWLKEEPPPQALAEFWAQEYPAMTSIRANEETIERAGYERLGSFVLPESDWTQGYFGPLETRIDLLRGKYAGDRFALDVLAEAQKEIDDYRRYSEWYGYAFFVCRRT